MSHSSNSFKWLQLLEVAKELNNSVKQNSILAEAKYRTVVGRAYYAAFNIAKEYLESAGLVFSNDGRAHTEVRSELRRIGGKAASAASKLNTLRDMRGRADYELNPSRGAIKWRNESAMAIKLAERIFQDIGSLL